MIAALKPYPAMKHSGVEWLGELPEHWEIRPLKRWVTINAEVLPETTDPDFEFRYLDIATVGTGVLIQKPQRLRFGAAPSRARRVVHAGDTIASTVRTYLKAIYYIRGESDNLVCSTGFAVLTPCQSTAPKFVSYLAQSNPFTNRVTADSVGIAYPAIAETRLGSFHVAVPPFPEQAAIVRFLDYLDRRIRRYVRAKQNLIKLLEEQKQAIIHRAVTRGLDPNVRLKPSGVEWLGEVPADWEVRRLKTLVTESVAGPYGSSLTKAMYTSAGYRVYGQQQVIPDDFSIGDYYISDKKYEEMRRYRVFPGDVLISVMGTVGKVAVVPETVEPGIINPRLVRYRPRFQQVHPRYLQLAVQSPAAASQVGEAAKGTTMEGLNMQILGRMRLPIPSLAEQEAILSSVDAEIGNLNHAMNVASRNIGLLREYRTRLIADVVTGKLDVREAAARLPDEAEETERLDEAADEADALTGDDDEIADDLDAIPEEAEA